MRCLQVLGVSVPAPQKGLYSGLHRRLVMSEIQDVWPASVGAASSPALNSDAKRMQELYYFHFCWQGNWLWARKYLLLRPYSLNVVDSLPFQTSCTLTVVLLLKMWPRKWLEPSWNGEPLPQVDPAGLYEVTRWIWPTIRLEMCVLTPD